MADKPISIITKWTEYCMICGRPRDDMHHALYGNKHKLADEDKLLMPLCAYHHNSNNLFDVKRKPVTNMSVHQCDEMKALSQMLAEVCWERQKLAEKIAANHNALVTKNKEITAEKVIEDVREQFKNRYGEFYL